MSEPEQYPMGATVTFADTNRDSEQGVTGGPVNGPAITNDDGDVVAVPVYAQRNPDSDATTVYVNVNNILEVDDGSQR